MKKYTFFLGLNDKDTKNQLVGEGEALSQIENSTMEQLGGGSVSIVKGLFQHEDGTKVVENTIRIESLGFREEKEFIAYAEYLKLMYNQESVLLEVSEVQEFFI